MRVGVLGAGGKMGGVVCRSVEADAELELVAAIDPLRDGQSLASVLGVDLGGAGLVLAGDLEALSRAGVDAVVDFTSPGAVRANALWCLERGIHVVVGTTGLTDGDLAALREASELGTANCIVAANFALGAVLMMRMAELAAPWFETAEIIELHHDKKVDAPSGTALRTAERMAHASNSWGEDPTKVEVLPGARGGVGPGGIRIHSVRLKGLVAHQEVILGAGGEALTIRHDSFDRACFMPGVLMALKAVPARRGLTVGLEPLLGF